MDRLWRRALDGLTDGHWDRARREVNRAFPEDSDFKQLLDLAERIEQEHGLDRQSACYVALRTFPDGPQPIEGVAA